MPAGVRDVLVVGHRQCVEVGAQRVQLLGVVAVRRSEIAHETGSDSQATRFEPSEAESFLDQLGGGMLCAAELGMGMEGAP